MGKLKNTTDRSKLELHFFRPAHQALSLTWHLSSTAFLQLCRSGGWRAPPPPTQSTPNDFWNRDLYSHLSETSKCKFVLQFFSSSSSPSTALGLPLELQSLSSNLQVWGWSGPPSTPATRAPHMISAIWTCTRTCLRQTSASWCPFFPSCSSSAAPRLALALQRLCSYLHGRGGGPPTPPHQKPFRRG